MVAVGDEADLVAVRLLRNGQPELARLLAHGALVEVADRKHRVRELRLVQREEEVRLILRRVRAALQPVASGGGIEIHARVVTRRHELRAEPVGAVDERRELQVAVAVDARDRRAAGRILADEVRDDGLGELRLEIDDVVRDADARGHAARVVEVVDRAARAEAHAALVRSSCLVVQLHRQPDDVVPLARQQRGGHRRVDAARHGYDNTHALSRVSGQWSVTGLGWSRSVVSGRSWSSLDWWFQTIGPATAGRYRGLKRPLRPDLRP